MGVRLVYGCVIEEFLDSIYLAGADIGGTRLEDYARSIERSNKMLTLLNSAVDILFVRQSGAICYFPLGKNWSSVSRQSFEVYPHKKRNAASPARTSLWERQLSPTSLPFRPIRFLHRIFFTCKSQSCASLRNLCANLVPSAIFLWGNYNKFHRR